MRSSGQRVSHGPRKYVALRCIHPKASTGIRTGSLLGVVVGVSHGHSQCLWRRLSVVGDVGCRGVEVDGRVEPLAWCAQNWRRVCHVMWIFHFASGKTRFIFDGLGRIELYGTNTFTERSLQTVWSSSPLYRGRGNDRTQAMLCSAKRPPLPSNRTAQSPCLRRTPPSPLPPSPRAWPRRRHHQEQRRSGPPRRRPSRLTERSRACPHPRR